MEIKTYSESYLEKQYEIGNSLLKNWLGARQSPVSRLKKVYSQPDFDPNTKFYAIDQGEVVGFIPAKQTGDTTANLEFPMVKEGYSQAEEMLMEYAFTALRNMGIKELKTRASPLWGETMSMTDKYGYELSELMWKNAELKVDSYKAAEGGHPTQNVTESDLPEVKEIMISFRENSEEEAQRQIHLLQKISERVTSWKIVRQDGRIVGHDHLVQDIAEATRARMNAIFAESDSVRNSIMNAHVEAARAAGIQQIDNFFWGATENMDEPYRDYGFEISNLYAYKKEL